VLHCDTCTCSKFTDNESQFQEFFLYLLLEQFCLDMTLIMLSPLYHYCFIFAADFGFARFLEGGVMAETLCGSPMYMVRIVLSLDFLSSFRYFYCTVTNEHC